MTKVNVTERLETVEEIFRNPFDDPQEDSKQSINLLLCSYPFRFRYH